MLFLTNRWIKAVKLFHKKFDLPIEKTHHGFRLASKDMVELITLRQELDNEEHIELNLGLEKAKSYIGHGCWFAPTAIKVEILDAIVDSIYVLIGMAVAFGFDLQGAFDEVQRSNMSKLGADGKPLYREDGKVLKGPNFRPPQLEKYI